MSIKMKELPVSERPYEKLELYGEKALSEAELLAIIIKTGTKTETSVELSKRILGLNENIDSENLNFLREKSIEEFMQIKGIGRVKAIQLKALCEFATRMNKPLDYRRIKIRTPGDIAQILTEEMRNLKTEKLKCIILNNSNEILKIKNITEGTSNIMIVDAKNILSDVIKMQAPKIILVHNHPSGSLTPSQNDIDFTKKIDNACKILGVQLLDHIIIAENNYLSILHEISKNIKG